MDGQLPQRFNVSLGHFIWIVGILHFVECWCMCRRFQNTIYIIPKGSIIPENMALLRDERILPSWTSYNLIIREPCLPEAHERIVADFVVKNETRLCFQCVNRPPPHNF